MCVCQQRSMTCRPHKLKDESQCRFFKRHTLSGDAVWFQIQINRVSLKARVKLNQQELVNHPREFASSQHL